MPSLSKSSPPEGVILLWSDGKIMKIALRVLISTALMQPCCSFSSKQSDPKVSFWSCFPWLGVQKSNVLLLSWSALLPKIGRPYWKCFSELATLCWYYKWLAQVAFQSCVGCPCVIFVGLMLGSYSSRRDGNSFPVIRSPPTELMTLLTTTKLPWAWGFSNEDMLNACFGS